MRVVKGDEGVRAADGEIAGCRSQGEGDAGGRVSVEGMEGLHGGIGSDQDGAVGAGEEEVRGWRCVREAELVGLDVLRL